MTDKERYATIETWADYFTTSEDVPVGASILRKKMKAAEKIGETARSNVGRVFLNAYYSETDVREVLRDVLDPELRIEDKEGHIRVDGVKYVNLHSFRLRFGATSSLLLTLVEEFELDSVRGRSKTKITQYYPEQALLNIWRAYMKLPAVNVQGCIEQADDVFYTVRGLSKLLDSTDHTVRSAIRAGNIEPITGRDQHNVKRLFYPLDKIRSLLELNRDLPKADSDGFIEIEGERYATLATWCRVSDCKIDARTLASRMSKLGIEGESGIDQSGVPRDRIYFKKEQFNQACSDITSGTFSVNQDGYVEFGWGRYYAICQISQLLNVSEATLRRCARLNSPPFLKARNAFGQLVKVYELETIKKLMAALTMDLPQAGSDGFFLKNGKRYANLITWKQVLGISADHRTLAKRAAKLKMSGIDGYSSNHVLRKNTYYAESDIRRFFADLTNKRKKK